MADTNETIADIIAEMRGMGNYQRYSGDHARVLAGRLEAAQKRELAVYVLAIAKLRGALVKCRDIALLWQVDEAAGVAGTTDKPHARSAAEAVIDIELEINAALFATATAEKLSAVGDAAKLREALKLCVDEMCNRCHESAAARGNPLPCLSGCEPVRKAKAALAALPRNCDCFKTAAEAAHKRERGDCAKLREALEKIRAIAKTFMDATQMRRVTDSARIDVGNIKDLADAALAEPVKNCEVGTAEEQFERWETFCDSYDKNCTGCLCDDGHTCTLAYCFAKWAQMPYVKKEGGAE